MNENIVEAFLFFLFSCGALYACTRIVLQLINRRRPPAGPDTAQLEARLTRIEQIVESTALEVERIGEGNRFVTKLMAERQPDVALPRPSGRVNTPR